MVEFNVDRQIRVLIVDDHPMVRDGTRTYLEQASGIAVIGVTGEGVTTLRLVSEQQPDVLLLDLHLPDMSGIDVAKHVSTNFPNVAVLILTGYDEIEYIRALLQMGVRGYLLKTVSGEEIVTAVRAVAAGKRIMISEALPGVAESGPEPLTDRERQVLRLLVADCRNSEMAAILNVTVKTVEFHISHILEKLGVRSRAAAIRKAKERGLLDEGAEERD
ncbi:Response regulator receiver domain protein [Nitrolancea hollandica Lb]|uniref:Response regulator receiver domain protein n=2 Tax=Nitrolancea hollandica TaxID=1206749 RepID=I4EMX0_9BACT|nr:response regulator transcription factor [Nitrolancea hollandica]CCF86033.1 Response regulator receiver domain protein [Nitrolancea hollandica Lb]